MNGRIASVAYRPALLTRTSSDRTARDGVGDQPLDVLLRGDVDGEPESVVVRRGGLLGATKVGDHDACARLGEPVRDRATDPLCPARDDGDLPGQRSRAHWSGENVVGTRMRFCWVWISGEIFGEEGLPVVARLEGGPPVSRSSNES